MDCTMHEDNGSNVLNQILKTDGLCKYSSLVEITMYLELFRDINGLLRAMLLLLHSFYGFTALRDNRESFTKANEKKNLYSTLRGNQKQ